MNEIIILACSSSAGRLTRKDRSDDLDETRRDWAHAISCSPKLDHHLLLLKIYNLSFARVDSFESSWLHKSNSNPTSLVAQR